MAQAAENHQEVSHQVTIFAEPILNVGGFTITNSLVNSFLAVLVLVLFFVFVGRQVSKIPKGLQNFFEMILEGALNFADTITGDRKKSEKFLPVVLTLFLFILVNNWLGLLPGVGTVGFLQNHDGHEVFVPLLRGATADLNTTIALALFAVVGSHVVGVFSIGFWNHLNKFINIQAFLEIPKKFSKDKTVSFVNPIKAFVGIIEIVSEGAKVASLSLRLFGNIFAGEVLLTSMMAIFAFVLPLPFMFLEVLVGVIQASVFSILVLVFMSMSTHAEH